MIDTKTTARNAIIWGFIISCAALLVNAIVLSEVTNRLRDTETAHAALTETLNRQMNVKEEGEKKFESYRLQYNLAPVLPEKTRENMIYDAGSHFHDYVLNLYAAGNDLSMTEFRRAETEIEIEESTAPTDETESSENEPKTADQNKTETENFDRAFMILENVKDDSGKINYKAKHRAISTITDLIVDTKNDDLSDARLERIDSFLNVRFVESYDKKQLEITRLKDLRDYQSSLVNYCIFGSLVLQMLGLAFIFLKDFIQEKRG